MSRQVPTYRKHKNGQAFVKTVRLNGGKAIYLGKHGSPESRKAYQEILKRLEVAESAPELKRIVSRRGGFGSIEEVVDSYTDHAVKRYSNADGPTTEYTQMVMALDSLLEMFGHLPVDEFEPDHLVALQEHLLAGGALCRGSINHRICRVRRMFRWASTFRHAPKTLYWELKSVEPVPFGRGFESPEVEPVAWPVVEATLPWLTPVVGTMVMTQVLCGMRPQDVCRLRMAHVNTSDSVWIYSPTKHKGTHRGKKRFIAIPACAQALLQPYLDRPADQHLFSPRESYRLLRWQMAKENGHRKTKVYPCEIRAREKRAVESNGGRRQRDHYDTDSYRRAIVYGLERAAKRGTAIPHWHPHQLRHTISTQISQELGEQAAQRWLGHERLETTGIYTQRQVKELAKIARKFDSIWAGSASKIAGRISPLPAPRYDAAKCTASAME